jgi:hypothetical protein
MSGSITPGLSAGGMIRGLPARLFFLIALSSLWTDGTLGMPGADPSRFGMSQCQQCVKEGRPHEMAQQQLDGSFRCDYGHVFFVAENEEEEGAGEEEEEG